MTERLVQGSAAATGAALADAEKRQERASETDG
jgi:hypothetical protein